MIISIIWWSRIAYYKLKVATIVLTIHVVLVLLTTRVHYSIDVVAAVIVTLWMDIYIGRYVKYFDVLFSWIFKGI